MVIKEINTLKNRKNLPKPESRGHGIDIGKEYFEGFWVTTPEHRNQEETLRIWNAENAEYRRTQQLKVTS